MSHLSAPLSLTSPHVRRIDELERRISELQLELKASKGEPDRSKRATQADQPSQSVQTDLTDQSGPSDQSEPSDRHVLVD